MCASAEWRRTPIPPNRDSLPPCRDGRPVPGRSGGVLGAGQRRAASAGAGRSRAGRSVLQRARKRHPGCVWQLPDPDPAAHGAAGGPQGARGAGGDGGRAPCTRAPRGRPPLHARRARAATQVLLVPVEQSYDKYKFALKKMVRGPHAGAATGPPTRPHTRPRLLFILARAVRLPVCLPGCQPAAAPGQWHAAGRAAHHRPARALHAPHPTSSHARASSTPAGTRTCQHRR